MKPKPLNIGLLLSGNEKWLGGLYYVVNIVRSLHKQPGLNRQFFLTVFYPGSVPLNVLKEVADLGDVNLVRMDEASVPKRAVNFFSRHLLNRNLILDELIKATGIDLLFPLLKWDKTLPGDLPVLYWIPDFQHEALPQFFSEEELKMRRKTMREIGAKARHVLLSSEVAREDFRKLYPDSGAALHIYRFPSLFDVSSLPSTESVRSRYGIRKPFFLVSNQFWQHKNHITVLKAMQMIGDRADFEILLTGNMADDRNNAFISDIDNMVRTTRGVRHLGLIDRTDQLAIMRDAIAVIQPSLFEGWGTVIEDARLLKVPVLASDIPVHREQLGEGPGFFHATDENALAEKILEIQSTRDRSAWIPPADKCSSADDLIQIFERVVGRFKK